MSRHVRCGLLVAMLLALGGCNEEAGDRFTEAVEANQQNLAALHIETPGVVLTNSTRRQFRAIATTTAAAEIDYSSKVSWRSSNPQVASVSSSGEVAALREGDVTISASFAQLLAQMPIRVSSAALQSININLDSANIDACRNVPISASGVYDDGSLRPITDLVSWQSDNVALAEFDSVTGNAGVLRTFDAGSLDISASISGISARRSITIDASLSGLSVSPAELTLSERNSSTFAATATFADGASVDVSENASWSVLQTSSIASVYNIYPGKGRLSASNAGSATLQASCGGLSASANITVTPQATLQRVQISTGENPLRITTDETLSLTLSAIYADGSSADVSEDASWQVLSGDSSINVSNESDSKGEISYSGVGSALIEATYEDLQAQVRVTVEAP